MTSSNENIKRIISAILLITLISLPHINETVFFIAAAIFHIALCEKTISLIPKEYKVTKLLCFLLLLGLLPFSTNAINGLSNGILETIQEYKSIPLVYQRICEELTIIPSAISKRDISVFTPHIFLLGITGIVTLGKHLWLSRKQ